MYKNCGAKIKGLATTIVVLMMIAVIIAGVVVMSHSFFGGLLVIAGGCFAAWLSGLMMAAFGELVENTYHIRKLMENKLDYAEGAAKASEKPVYADVSVTPAEINAVMKRDGVPYGEAVVIAKKEKMAGSMSSNTGAATCPDCGNKL